MLCWPIRSLFSASSLLFISKRSPSGALADGTGPRRHRPAAAQDRNRGAKAQQIALRAESDHLPFDDVGKERMPTKFLSLVNVREMDFDDGNAGGQHGVAQGNRRVRVRPW